MQLLTSYNLHSTEWTKLQLPPEKKKKNFSGGHLGHLTNNFLLSGNLTRLFCKNAPPSVTSKRSSVILMTSSSAQASVLDFGRSLHSRMRQSCEQLANSNSPPEQVKERKKKTIFSRFTFDTPCSVSEAILKGPLCNIWFDS